MQRRRKKGKLAEHGTEREVKRCSYDGDRLQLSKNVTRSKLYEYMWLNGFKLEL